jgi:hypothetical protein
VQVAPDTSRGGARRGAPARPPTSHRKAAAACRRRPRPARRAPSHQHTTPPLLSPGKGRGVVASESAALGDLLACVRPAAVVHGPVDEAPEAPLLVPQLMSLRADALPWAARAALLHLADGSGEAGGGLLRGAGRAHCARRAARRGALSPRPRPQTAPSRGCRRPSGTRPRPPPPRRPPPPPPAARGRRAPTRWRGWSS